MARTRTVLLVESDDLTRAAVVGPLEKQGVTVIEARDAVEGLALAGGYLPDLVVIDTATLILDGMSGQALLKQLRKKDWCTHVPIIVLIEPSADDPASWEMPEEPTFFFSHDAMDPSELLKEIEHQLEEVALTE